MYVRAISKREHDIQKCYNLGLRLQKAGQG
jgi:hypothetical protein